MRSMARSVTLVILGLGLAALAVGCGGATTPAENDDDIAPIIAALSVAPRTVGAQGGSVGMSVTALDNDLVAGVVFTVTQGATTRELLGELEDGKYVATFAAPTNAATVARVYSVAVTAHDPTGNQSAELTSSFTVAGLTGPPAGRP